MQTNIFILQKVTIMIRKVHFENIVGIESFSNEIPFPAITVIIGKNDVCKTSLLKALYVSAKSAERYSLYSQHNNEQNLEQIIAKCLSGVYGRTKNGIGDIVRKNGTPHRLTFSVEYDVHCPFKSMGFSFGQDARKELKKSNVNFVLSEQTESCSNAIFVPAKEVITAFPAIKAIVNRYFYPGYDDTTMDLIEMLDVPEINAPIENNYGQDMFSFCEKVSSMFAGELKQVNSAERFVYKRGTQEFAMSMTAEGVKHIGVLSTLIKNGQLTSNSVLLLDEPEDNLHPSAVRQLMKILVGLSRCGVQIFLTTHNYFVLKQLQIEACRDKSSILCCSLARGEDGTIESTFADLREGLPENDIIKETLAMYDEDIELEFHS